VTSRTDRAASLNYEYAGRWEVSNVTKEHFLSGHRRLSEEQLYVSDATLS